MPTDRTWQTQGAPHNELNLNAAFANGFLVRNDVERMLYLLSEYPWVVGSCNLSSLAEIHARVERLYDIALMRAEELAEPEEAETISNLYGAMVRLDRSAIDLFVNEAFTPALMVREGKMQFYAAYWENRTAEVLPTQDEAIFLLLEHRADFQSLTTAGLWEDEYALAQNTDFEWESRPDFAARAMAMSAVEWSFAGITCD